MKRTLTIAALVGALALGGCISNNPNASHTTEGAVSGGLIGAAIGALARPHHAGTGALIGAGIGALTGAAIGSSVDRHEAMWRWHMRHRAVLIRRDGHRVVLSIQNDFLFNSDSADISPRAQRTLRHVAAMLRHHGQSGVEVDGYTDTVGAPDANQQLSQARADAVAGVLEHYGVENARISTHGFGEAHQRVQTDDNVSEPLNRRVEIVLEPAAG